MFKHLNVNSQRILYSLCSGNSATVGSRTLDAINGGSQSLLALLANNILTLKDMSAGRELVDAVVSLGAKFKFEDIKEVISKAQTEATAITVSKKFRIGKIKALSFRGLAPAGKVWEYDFTSKSHLIYGPNGSGKSSLLGAISWCLTGKLFRDDCPPSGPQEITAYPLSGKAVVKVDFDAAQTFMDEAGNHPAVKGSYWVELELVSAEGNIYLKRDSLNGLSYSKNEINWNSITNLNGAGIDDLDAELRILMPARVSNLRFGKNLEIIRLLSDITGYGDIETVSEIAEKLVSASKRAVTEITKKEMEPEKSTIQNAIAKIKENETVIKGLASYKKICSDSRTKEDVEAFSQDLSGLVEERKKQLASDLGLIVPEKEKAQEFAEWEEESKNLPGQVSNLTLELSKPVNGIFASSIGLAIPSDAETAEIELKLQRFQREAFEKIKEKSQWAARQQADSKLTLLLIASGYLKEGEESCPVCSQSLKHVPQIKLQLENLKELVCKEYLKKDVEDFVRSLIADLDSVVMPSRRDQGAKQFSERLSQDWAQFKSNHCKGLLLSVARKYDREFDAIVAGLDEDKIERLSEDDANSTLYADFLTQIHNAHRFVQLCKTISSNIENVSSKVKAILLETDKAAGLISLKEVIERARNNNEELKLLCSIQGNYKELMTRSYPKTSIFS